MSLAGLLMTVRSLLRRRHVEEELNEEFAYHLDRQIDAGLAAGLAPDDARYAVLRSMGGIDQSKETCRDVRGVTLIADVVSDLRYAGRMMRRSPAFTALAVAVMALGIGANTAVFTVVNRVLLQSLPYPHADRIVALRTALVRDGRSQAQVSLVNVHDWRDQSTSFEAMSLYRGFEYPVTVDTAAEYARVAAVDDAFFRVFSVAPMMGRGFTPEEIGIGNEHVVISHAYWRSHLGSDPAVLGRIIRIGLASRQIVGVMPPGFRFPDDTDVWAPHATRPTNRAGHNVFGVGRLKPGVPLDVAQSELTSIAARLEQQYPENEGRGALAIPLQEELVGDLRVTLYLPWAVVGVVLLIACANTATLLLGRATARAREIAMRVALGASRVRIVRQLTTESLLLSLVAGVTGVLVAYWGAPIILALAPANIARLTLSSVDGSVLLFTLTVSVATSLLCGLVPAIQASKVELTDTMNQGGTRLGTSGRLIRTRSVLVVSEIALTALLVIAAALVTKTLVAVQNVELGYKPEHVLVAKATGVRRAAENNAFFRDLTSRLAALPGVLAVGATSTPPGDVSFAGSGSYFIDRLPAQRDRTNEPQSLMTIIAPGTFGALGIPLTNGRDFNEADTSDRPLVAIVNEALVRRSFAGKSPIGRTILCPFDRFDPMTIVGVVGDARQRNPALPADADCFMPYTQHSYNANTLHVVIRTTGDPTALASTVRRIGAEIAPDVPLSFTTMEDAVAKGVAAPRFRAVLFGAFAGLALCLAMAGIYGVTAYAVKLRTREIGVRMALGSTKRAVLQLMVKQGMVLAAAGLVLGLGAALATTGLLKRVLFEVRPVDVQVYVAVSVLLGLVTLVAGYIPARRATMVDPADVLRTD